MGKKEVQNNSSLVGIGWIVLLVFVASVLVSGFDTGFTGITGYATADVVECKTEGVNLDSSKTISGVRIMKPTFDGGSVILNVGGTQYTNVGNGKVIELDSNYQTDGLKKITVRELNRPVVELEVYSCKTKPQRQPKVAKVKAPKINKNDVLNLKIVLDSYGGQNSKVIDRAIKSYQKSQKKLSNQIKRSEKLEKNYKTRAGKVGSTHRKYSAFKNLEVKYKDLAVSQRLKNGDYGTIISRLELLKLGQKPDEIISNLRADGKFVPGSGEPRDQLFVQQQPSVPVVPVVEDSICNLGFVETYCALQNARIAVDNNNEKLTSVQQQTDGLTDNQLAEARAVRERAAANKGALDQSLILANNRYNSLCLKDGINVCEKCGVPNCNTCIDSDGGQKFARHFCGTTERCLDGACI